VITYVSKRIKINTCWRQSTVTFSSYLVLITNGNLSICCNVDSREKWECCCGQPLPIAQRLLFCLRVSRRCPLFLLWRVMLRTRCLWCIRDMILKADREKTNSSHTVCSRVTLSTTNFTWTVLGWNVGPPR
jgi:hypothetical protein